MAEIEDILTELVQGAMGIHQRYPGAWYRGPRYSAAITNAAKQIRQQQRERGEFPDEGLKKLLLDSASLSPESLFWAIKCLIEGQPATKEEADDA